MVVRSSELSLILISFACDGNAPLKRICAMSRGEVATAMNDKIEQAERQLDRLLGFFPRVDSKVSALFAIDSTLLGIMALRFSKDHLSVWFVCAPAVLALLLIVAAITFLYLSGFPHLKGGGGSLIYFGEIAKLSENRFSTDWNARDANERLSDTLSQVWRNADILRTKFKAVRVAFILTAIALVPWAIFLATSSWPL